jgi:hypothetical protein
MRTKRIAVRLLTLLALTTPMQAIATPPPKAQGPSAEYDRGFAAIEAKNWTKAYEIFSDLWAHPKSSDSESDVAISLGQAELKLGKYRDAAEHLAIGILMAPEQDTKERAGKGLAFAKKKIGTLLIAAPDGTEISINGKAIGTAPIPTEVFVEPGSTKVTGKHPTQGSGEAQFETKPADERKVELQLLRAAPTSAPLNPPYSSAALNQPKPTQQAPTTTTPPPTVERRHGIETKTIVLIAGGVVTLAAAGTATYFGLTARAAGKDASDLTRKAASEFGSHRCSSVDAQDSQLCSRIRDKIDDHDSAARVFNIVLPVAGVTALATGILYALWPGRSMTAARDNLTLVPIATQQSGGFMLRGSF